MRSKILTLLLVLGFVFCWALPVWADDLSSQGIAVGGTGRIVAVPDMAEITVGVVTQGPTASQAQEENNRLMQAVLQKLKEIGLSEAEIKTGELSLFPEYASSEKEQTPRIVSYRATSTLIVTVKPVEKAGLVVDAALAGGANQVHSLRCLVSNTAELQLKALTLAVQAARQKAEVVAQALGVQLGPPRSVAVEAGEPWAPVYRAAAMSLQDATPVLPGQVEITASVQVTYSIVP